MRKALHARVRPLVERFANQLSDLATARVETELARIEESLEVALSTYESDGGPDLLAVALGPELVRMMAPAPARMLRERCMCHCSPCIQGDCSKCTVHGAWCAAGPPPLDAKLPSHRAREERAAPPATGKKPITCSKCGFVGGNSRGCGKAHPTRQSAAARELTTQDAIREAFGAGSELASLPPPIVAMPARAATPERRLKPTPAALELAKRRAAERNTERSAPPRHQAVEPDDVEGTAAEERWSPERIASEREHAEANKLEGELPRPRASFEVDPVDRVGGMAPVRELEPEDELDFGGADR